MPRLVLLLLLLGCSETHTAAAVHQRIRVDTSWTVFNAKGQRIVITDPVVVGDSVTGLWYDR